MRKNGINSKQLADEKIIEALVKLVEDMKLIEGNEQNRYEADYVLVNGFKHMIPYLKSSGDKFLKQEAKEINITIKNILRYAESCEEAMEKFNNKTLPNELERLQSLHFAKELLARLIFFKRRVEFKLFSNDLVCLTASLARVAAHIDGRNRMKTRN